MHCTSDLICPGTATDGAGGNRAGGGGAKVLGSMTLGTLSWARTLQGSPRVPFPSAILFPPCMHLLVGLMVIRQFIFDPWNRWK